MNHPNYSRVLIVDDNAAIHDDFRKILTPKADAGQDLAEAEAALFGDAPAPSPVAAHQFQLDSAHQGMDGLALVKKALTEGRPYALAFMDVRMPPGWDGIETTAKIWEIDPDIQIVLCTAYSDYSWDEILAKLGATDRLVILKKPFDNIEVAQLAHSLTRKWQLLQESKKRVATLEQTVTDSSAQIILEQQRFKSIFDNSPEGIFQTTREGKYIAANQALAGIYGYATPQDLMEQLTDTQAQLYVDPARRPEWQRRMDQEKVVREFVSEIRCGDGTTKWISETACKLKAPDGSFLYYQGFVVDVTAERTAECERNLMEVHLRHAQKLESVGQLAAGIAHEINTPIQYIGDNIRFVEEAVGSISRLLTEYQTLAGAVRAGKVSDQILAEVDACAETADFAYLSREIPVAVRQSLDGVKQVANIVQAMKEFSHPGAVEKVPLNLNDAIQTTITVARSEWKYVAKMETELDPHLSLTPCVRGEINQVILNLIVNAAHAIHDAAGPGEAKIGTIKITTRAEPGWSVVEISDTGTGIKPEHRRRIFEPFFTTKEVGKGTGQGLALAHSIIVTKHQGQLAFETVVGGGTTFSIRLPVPPERDVPPQIFTRAALAV